MEMDPFAVAVTVSCAQLTLVWVAAVDSQLRPPPIPADANRPIPPASGYVWLVARLLRRT